MTKKEKTIRLAISGAFLVVVALTAITIYQTKSNQNKQEENYAKAQENEANGTEEGKSNTTEIRIDGNTEDEVAKDETAQDDTTKEVESTDASANDVEAVTEKQDEENKENKAVEQEDKEKTEENVKDDADTEPTQAEALPSLEFDEETLIEWPVNGSVLMDYSMDKTVHFETLDVYKYNPALIIGAQDGEEVKAVANSKVLSIIDDEETGTTITMDMGNGYKAVYGQLKDVQVEVEQVVEGGTVLGTINNPTKYYTKEGLNLYFAMSKDDKLLDPILYLP